VVSLHLRVNHGLLVSRGRIRYPTYATQALTNFCLAASCILVIARKLSPVEATIIGSPTMPI
jgi:hypothetical protein